MARKFHKLVYLDGPVQQAVFSVEVERDVVRVLAHTKFYLMAAHKFNSKAPDKPPCPLQRNLMSVPSSSGRNTPPIPVRNMIYFIP
jgi:hypothetical protein